MKFTWELKVGEDRAGKGPGLGKSTEPGKTKIYSGVAQQINRIRPDGTRRYNVCLYAGNIFTVKITLQLYVKIILYI